MLICLDDALFVDPREVVAIQYVPVGSREWRVEFHFRGGRDPLSFNVTTDKGQEPEPPGLAEWAEAINAARSVPGRL